MSVSLNVAFSDDVPPFGKIGGDHLALVKSWDPLEEAGFSRGLKTLGHFLSIDPEELAEMSGMPPEELEGLGVPPLQWFDPGDGLAAMQLLAAFLRDEPEAVPNSTALVAELEEVAQELAAAQSRGVTFHFCMCD